MAHKPDATDNFIRAQAVHGVRPAPRIDLMTRDVEGVKALRIELATNIRCVITAMFGAQYVRPLARLMGRKRAAVPGMLAKMQRAPLALVCKALLTHITTVRSQLAEYEGLLRRALEILGDQRVTDLKRYPQQIAPLSDPLRQRRFYARFLRRRDRTRG